MDEEKWLGELLLGVWSDSHVSSPHEPQAPPAELGVPDREGESQEQPAVAGGDWLEATIDECSNLMQIMFSYTELALVELPRESTARDHLQHAVAARDDVKTLLQRLFFFNHQIAETIVQVLMGAAQQSQSKIPRDSEMWQYLRQAIETGERAKALLQRI